MKKLMFFAGLYCLQPSLQAAPVIHPSKEIATAGAANERAIAHFNANYAGAREVSWYTLDNQNIYCVSHRGDTVNRVFYDKHGYWKYTLLSYPGYDLAKNVKDQVTDYFTCYQVTSVTEIRAHNIEPVYVIDIENDKNIKIVRVSDDDIDVQQDMEKL
jgi:hypothetical protein